MHAAVRKYSSKDSAETLRRVRAGFVPIISSADGFIDYYAIDAGDGTIVTVSVFEDLAGANRSIHAAAEWVRDNLIELMEGPPEITLGDVAIHAAR
jgi:quinol monooxygenase YgiN